MLHLTNEGSRCLTSRRDMEGIEPGSQSDRESMAMSRSSDFTKTPTGKGDGDVWTARDDSVSVQDFCRPSLRRDFYLQVDALLGDSEFAMNCATRSENAFVDAHRRNARFSCSRWRSRLSSVTIPTSDFISLTAATGTSMTFRASVSVVSCKEAGSAMLWTSPSCLASSALNESRVNRISNALAAPNRRAR